MLHTLMPLLYVLVGIGLILGIGAAFALVLALLGPDGDSAAIKSHYGPF